jgi:hypothetical protein
MLKKRRKFVTRGIQLLLGLLLVPSVSSKTKKRVGKRSFLLGGPKLASHQVLLKSNAYYIAEAGKEILLPKKRIYLGDKVTIAVTADSLLKNCSIKYEDTPIAGDKENLNLDMLAIFQLEYRGKENGWIYSVASQNT